MRFYRVSEADADWLDSQPETAMGMQVALLVSPNATRPVIVVGGIAVIDPGTDDDEVELERWMMHGEPQEREDAFALWLGNLSIYGSPLAGRPIARSRSIVDPAFRQDGPSGPGSGLPAGSSPNAPPYGHLPYFASTAGGEVFYRFEPFPVSRRINQKTRTVSAGTFTAPASEVRYVSSGFGAIGRYALPNLLPANWRWELRPPLGTAFRCGASVPLHGQSGGGVEVEFGQKFVNVGPIANPFVLHGL